MKTKYAFTLYEKKVGKVPLGLKGTPVILLSDFEKVQKEVYSHLRKQLILHRYKKFPYLIELDVALKLLEQSKKFFKVEK